MKVDQVANALCTDWSADALLADKHGTQAAELLHSRTPRCPRSRGSEHRSLARIATNNVKLVTAPLAARV
jgi:hypothetical protein